MDDQAVPQGKYVRGPHQAVWSWLYQLCRLALGGIFIYAGFTKLLEPEPFAVLIDAFGIIPKGLLMPVTISLPLFELVAGLGLLFDIRGSLATIAGLLVLFMVLLGYGILMGLDIDCGCFGPDDPEAEAFHGLKASLVRDLIMMTGVVYMYGFRRYSIGWAKEPLFNHQF